MEWTQVYDPLGAAWLSTLMAATPIVVLLGLLVAGVSAHRAAIAGLAVSLLIATVGYGMPVSAAGASAAYGAAFGLLPIGWIVLTAVFLFRLTVSAGQFEIVKRSVVSLSPDRRMQALLIAFSFGSFIEGAAGFGTPVAISAALLIGIGFSPLYAAGLALLANTAPVAFGALGTPIITLAKISGLDEMALSQVAGRQLPLLSLIIPVWLIATMSGWRGVVGCWPAILVSGGSFAGLQFVMANYHGPALVDVVGGVGSMLSLTIFLRFWQPKDVWRFPEEGTVPRESSSTVTASPTESGKAKHAAASESSGEAIATESVVPREPVSLPAGPLTRSQLVRAWGPWALLSLMVFLWGWPDFKTLLNGGTGEQRNVLASFSRFTWNVPQLHGVVYRTSPVAVVREGQSRADDPEKAAYEFNWLSTTGTGIFLAAVLTAFWLKISPGVFVREFLDTIVKMRWALLTIACMLALAFTTKYCGSDATLGLAFTKTGRWYPFFAPLLGWLGVALTGSDTSSNALFGSLQRITAEQLQLNPILIVGSNSTGGVMGKMIDAQSIVVAAVATEQTGGEGKILRFVFWHSLVLAGLVGLLTFAQAYWIPQMVPRP